MKKWFWLLLLLLAAGGFWLPLLIPGHAPFLRDLSSEIISKRAFAAGAGGQVLWDPYGFFGHPFAANPQSEAFYPFNFLFLLMPATSALGWYVFLHWTIFLFFAFLAFRELGFEKESAFAMSVALGFGGFFCSLSLLIVLLSTVSWTPVMLFLVVRAMKGRTFFYALLAGLVFAVQVLAGEMEMALLGFLIILAVLAVHRPGEKPVRRAALALFTVFICGMVLSSFQWLLTWQMLGLSNRAGGVDPASAQVWSLVPVRLRELVLPNYFIADQKSELWGLGFFSGVHYLSSIYLGLGVALLAGAGLWLRKGKALFWLMFSLLGIAVALGQYFPIYGWLHDFVPGFSLFRFPEKFVFLPAFGIVMMAGLGLERIFSSKSSWPLAGLGLVLIGLVLAVLLLAFPLRAHELGNQYESIRNYLIYRSLFRSLAGAAILLGLVLWKPWLKFNGLKLLAGLVLWADLFLAHRLMNPPIASSAYQAPASVLELFRNLKARPLVPVRIFTEPLPPALSKMGPLMSAQDHFIRFRDSLMPFWGMYFGLDDARAHSSFYLRDQDLWLSTLAARGRLSLVLARSGVEYFHRYDQGFSRVVHPQPRAMVYYRAVSGLSREQILSIWPDPNFPALETLLMEGEARPELTPSAILMSEPAKIVGYQNEKVVIEATAKRDGWLVLLDSYYPGWEAYVDGKPEKIYRADGFFRAVSVPAGEHTVEFRYLPKSFIYGMIGSGFGLLAWSLALIISLQKWKR